MMYGLYLTVTLNLVSGEKLNRKCFASRLEVNTNNCCSSSALLIHSSVTPDSRPNEGRVHFEKVDFTSSVRPSRHLWCVYTPQDALLKSSSLCKQASGRPFCPRRLLRVAHLPASLR